MHGCLPLDARDVTLVRMNDSRIARAAARATWIGRLTTLRDHTPQPLDPGTPSERFNRVTALTLAAWAMTGEPLPSYTRAEMPGRILRSWK